MGKEASISHVSESELRIAEKPPSLNYGVRFATAEELNWITERLKQMGRQTMNFRTMDKSGALILSDTDNNDKVVGWQGFNFINSHQMPEKFSLHLDPEYRSFLLGLALETTLYVYAREMQFPALILRMNKLETKSLMDYRMQSGIFSRIESKEMPESWLNMCQNCELHKKTCLEQEYFRIDVEKAVEFGLNRLGNFNLGQLPVKFSLIENKIRGAGPARFVAKVAA